MVIKLQLQWILPLFLIFKSPPNKRHQALSEWVQQQVNELGGTAATYSWNG